MPEVMVSAWECNRCDHTWSKRKNPNNKIPICCPHCNSPYWNKKRMLEKKNEKV